jgi:O-antigen ligase
LFLWECVTSKWQDLIPFGVGVQAAFPKGFCSSDPWFANLRHPENMFLLNFVESGLIGVLGLILLFVVAFYKSSIALKNANALPLALTTTYFMCSIFYVPLFHYLPFLENRPADRGIYNFFLFTLIWLIILVRFTEDKTQSLSNKLQ